MGPLRRLQHWYRRLRRPMGIPSPGSWAAGIPAELAFWDEWCRSEGGQWHDEFLSRLAPDTPLQSHITDVLELPPGATIQILDVGAGPLTYLGKRWAGHRLQITAVDPLADDYDRILARHGLTPPVPTRKGFSERLLQQFPNTRFDLVHARNCIDHAQDPILAIQQMVAVARPGGIVYMHHAVNEAKHERYQGFHRWNLFDRDGDLYMGNASESVNVCSLLPAGVQVTNQLFDGDVWMVTVIRKRPEPAASHLQP